MDNLLDWQMIAEHCGRDLQKPDLPLLEKRNKRKNFIEQTRSDFSSLIETQAERAKQNAKYKC